MKCHKKLLTTFGALAAGKALAAPFRALRFQDAGVEAKFCRGYYASQYPTDVVFFVILLLSQVRSSMRAC